MNTTIEALHTVRPLLQDSMFGSPLLYGALIIAFVGLMLIFTRINLRVGLVLILPALLAITGPGIVGPMLGTTFQWVGVMLLMGVSIAYAFLWIKLGR